MRKTLNFLSVICFSAFILIISANNSFSQILPTEKIISVAAYVRDTEIEAGIIRPRLAKADTVKIVPSAIPSNNEVAEFEKRVFELINQKRVENGLAPVAWSEDVAKIARLHSQNMAKFNFFSHRGLDGKMVDGRADSLGVTKWTAMGENIAYNRGYKDPLATVVEKWMLSEGHKENLLNTKWKESAIGIAVTDDGTYYFTQVFLKRK